MSSLPALRERIAEVLTPSRQPPGLPTGVEVLDAILPGGGIPIGRLTEMVAPRGGGRTTVLRTIVREVVRHGDWVAVIDASRTLYARDWTARELGVVPFRPATTGHRRPLFDHRPPVCFIRPRRAERAAWCADLLLRTGAFALVIVDGAAPLSRQVAARLTRLARDAGAALIVAGELAGESGAGGGATHLPGSLRLRVERARTDHRPRIRARRRGVVEWSIAEQPWSAAGGRWPGESPRASSPDHRTPLTLTIEKGGPRRSLEVSYAVPVARRLCAHPEVPDRRGVARSGAPTTRDAGARSRAAVARAPGGDPGFGVRDSGFGCSTPSHPGPPQRSERAVAIG